MKTELIFWTDQTDILLIPETKEDEKDIERVGKRLQKNGFLGGQYLASLVGTKPAIKVSLDIAAR